MTQIDWSKAPEWATHYGKETEEFVESWYLIEAGKVVKYSYDGVVQENEHGNDSGFFPCVSTLICRPAPWNGAGLPPANSVVEIRTVSAQTDWAKAKIKFASRNVVVWNWDEEPAINGLCTAYAHAIEIRPIRAPEQIAAEERAKGVADLFEAMTGHRDQIGWGDTSYTKMAEIIYDAGYRKQVAP